VNVGERDRGNTINHILINRIAADPTLEAAYTWVCQQRQHHHFNSDIWPLRRHWAERKPQIQALLLSGQYRFREQRLIQTATEAIEYWGAEDALVLKAISLVLTEEWLPLLSPQCFHIAGRGGLKGALRQVADQVGGDDYFYRTDVKSYYASINHGLLMAQVEQYVQDPLVLSLLWGYLKRVVNQGGWWRPITQGISLGCPLSPLMGALYLKPLDDRMAQLGVVYVRYMDDWVVLASSRWQLRRAIRAVRQQMARLRVMPHPDKTAMGRTAKGFDFLGYWVTPRGLRVAARTVAKMVDKVARLDEQGATASRLDRYLHHWGQWVRAGLGDRLMPGPVDRSQRLTYLDNLGYVRDVIQLWVRNHGYAESNRARVVVR
jgi:hypothetical protein